MPKKLPKELVRVIELFAGVGGFRIGLERASKTFRTEWSNQWEPARKRQDASEIYVARFGGKGHSNKDISTVPLKEIPEHDLLVGGFPCQDYSVARTLNKADGLAGKKGVLWWEIHRILKAKQPGFFFLENVDRLLKSPAAQRGRDFAVMLASLADLGYAVEWRVINAADYGMPQRRRRVFFLGYHKSTPLGKKLRTSKKPESWLLKSGIFAEAFPVQAKVGKAFRLRIEGDLAEVTECFNNGPHGRTGPFENAGVMVDRTVHTMAVIADHHGRATTLGDVLLPLDEVPAEFFIPEAKRKAWMYLKGSKREKRTNVTNGFSYDYMEGAMAFPDALDKPARTIITGEGGNAPSRFKHVVCMPDGRLRRLTPVELERLNMFPDGHTAGTSDSRRAFLMGNALVTGVIERVGKVLIERISGSPAEAP
ncbi:MAG: DNA (cytosine-5-)-methyltransferase [Flavobacteriales bacterium]|nr:DNA (cytosine-5-)-methyltransferase [Flavobacteriales bacterium]